MKWNDHDRISRSLLYGEWAAVEAEYAIAVHALSGDDFNAATRHFIKAAKGDHMLAPTTTCP